MPDSPTQHALIGTSNVGKTTFMAQLYQRLESGRGHLRSRKAPEHLTVIQTAAENLARGVAVEHTPTGTLDSLDLYATGPSGDVDLHLPEYSGETLVTTILSGRVVPDEWETVISAGHWILFIRPGAIADIRSIVDRPIQMSASGDDLDDDRTSPDFEEPLSASVYLVELLQILRYSARTERVGAELPRLTVVLTCWDELDLPDGSLPDDVFSSRLGLVREYVMSAWHHDAIRVFGLSAQGTRLEQTTPNEEFVDNGPSEMGYVITPDGRKEVDLTGLLVLP